MKFRLNCSIAVQGEVPGTTQGTSTGPNRPPKGPAGGPQAHRFYPLPVPTTTPRNISRAQGRQRQTNGFSSIGWVMGASPDTSMLGSSPGRLTRNTGTSPLGTSAPIPQFQHPSHELLDKNGFQQMKYDKWRARCLEERSQSGTCLSLVCTIPYSLLNSTYCMTGAIYHVSCNLVVLLSCKDACAQIGKEILVVFTPCWRAYVLVLFRLR